MHVGAFSFAHAICCVLCVLNMKNVFHIGCVLIIIPFAIGPKECCLRSGMQTWTDGRIEIASEYGHWQCALDRLANQISASDLVCVG